MNKSINSASRLFSAKVRRGQTMIVASVFLGVLLIFSLSLSTYYLTTTRPFRRVTGNVVARAAAEAGVQKALWCLNSANAAACGGTAGTNYPGETNVTVAPGTSFTTTVTGSGSERTVNSTGAAPGDATRKIRVKTTSSAETGNAVFSFALQVGDSGVYMENGSIASGTIYSNGSVSCQSTNAVIKGDAYVASDGNTLDKCRVKYDAHAHTIMNSDIDRNAYYTSISNTTVDGTSHPGSASPATTTLPNMNLAAWEALAEAGDVINGNYAPADGATLGPKKIIGNLTLGNGVDVTVTGVIWVLGNITTKQTSSLTVDPVFGANSTWIIADDPADQATKGKITIENGTTISGSGHLQSHLWFISTNTSTDEASPAITVDNTAYGAIFSAHNGVVRLKNNANVKAVTGKRLYLDQNAEVNYETSEFIDSNFSGSPSGSWGIKSETWQEIP
ncbi:MAG: hypothetical protein AAB562_00365 [Patescibacteria group bacterium]